MVLMSLGPCRAVLRLMPVLLQRWQCVIVYPKLLGSAGREGIESGRLFTGARVTWRRSLVAAEEQETQEVSKAVGDEPDGLIYPTHVGIGRSTFSGRDVVLLALRAFLCEHEDLEPADAEDIAKDSPAFRRKLVAAVRARISLSGSFDVDSWRLYAEDELSRLNVVEAFLESLGVNPRNWSEETMNWDLDCLVESVKVLEDLGIQRRQMGKVLDRDKLLLTSSAHDLRVAIENLMNLGFSRAEIAEVSLRLPGLLRVGLENIVTAVTQEPEGDDSNELDGLTMLRKNVRYLKRDLGFSDKQVIKLVQGYSKTSRVFSADLAEVTRDNIGVLKDLGLSNEDIRRVLCYSPAVINLTKENILEKIEYLRSLGVSKIGKVITRYPAVLQYSLGSNVVSKIEYLKSLGVDSSRLGKVLTQCPSILGYSIDAKLKPTIAFLEEIGLKGDKLARLIVTKPPVLAYSVEGSYADTREFLMKLGLVPGTKAMARAFAASFTCSVIAMQGRFEFFVGRGFPRECVQDMLKTQPSLLCLSEQNLLSKLSFFEGILDLHDMPASKVAIYLSFGLDSRIKPRFMVFSWLKEKGHIPSDYPFPRILDLSESRFYAKFLNPYPAASVVFSDEPKGHKGVVSSGKSEGSEGS